MKKNIISLILLGILILLGLIIFNKDTIGSLLLSEKAESLEKQRLELEKKSMELIRENMNLKSKIKFLEEKSKNGESFISEEDRVYEGLKDANKLSNKVAKELDVALSERAKAYNKICKTKLSTKDAEMKIQLYISYMKPSEEQVRKVYALKENEISKIGEVLNDKNFEQNLCKNKFKAEKTKVVN